MPIAAKCPSCGKVMNCPDELAGRQVPCSGCGQPYFINAQPGGPAKKSGGGGGGSMKMPLIVGGGVLAVLIVGGVVWMLTSGSKPAEVAAPAAAVEEKPAETESKPEVPKKPFELLPIEAVVLDPEMPVKLQFKIERNGNEGNVQLALDALPPGLAAAAAAAGVEGVPTPEGTESPTLPGLPLGEIPEGENSLEVEVPIPPEMIAMLSTAMKLQQAAEKPSEGIKLKIVAKLGEMSSSQDVLFKLELPKPPVLAAIAGFTLKPGSSREVEVKVDRLGFEGPLPISVAGLPPNVTVKPAVATTEGDQEGGAEPAPAPATPDAAAATSVVAAPVAQIPEGASSAKLLIAAAPTAKDGPVTVKITSVARDDKLETSFPLLIEAFAVRINPLPVVTLKPGESKTIDVTVARRSYKDALSLTLDNLPAKVTVKPVEIAANQTTAKLEIVAAEDALEHVKSAQITAKAGETPLKEALVIRVSKGEGGFLPKAVTVDPEMSKLLRKGGFGGRMEASSKQALMKAYGGTEESEAAVLAGLEWLAKKQKAEDGSWSLLGHDGASEGQPEQAAPAEGAAAAPTLKEEGIAATALGVLPFLAAGVTHDHAPSEPDRLKEFKPIVLAGLQHIAKSQVTDKKDPKKDGELPGGMYAHSLGAIALCEAYVLTQNDQLKNSAQRAVKYLINSQHAEGGWRYAPRQEGDTSVVAWVMLALQSGKLAGLAVDRSSLTKADRFMDSTAAGPEDAKLSRYCYQPGKAATLPLTAAGLLTREYIGWDKENPELAAGCKYLMQNLPPEYASSAGPMYYYYYATQVLHHMEGEDWDKWNHRMREHLIRTQEQSGEQGGSWSPVGVDHGGRGGRMYATSLALMTLEVYYRHLPLYRKAVKPTGEK